MHSGGRFKGYCRICGKQGHKTDQCWQNKNERTQAIMEIKEVEDQLVIVLPDSVFIVIKLGIVRMNVERKMRTK
jgi:hypothetical protein